MSKPHTMRCHECHYQVKLPSLTHKQAAVCPRCGLQLTVYHHNALQRIIALATTSLIFLLASLPFEFLSFSASGQYQSIDILGGLWVLVEKNYGLLALVQAIAVLILPAFVLISLLYLLIPLSLGLRPKKAEWVLKTLFKSELKQDGYAHAVEQLRTLVTNLARQIEQDIATLPNN